MNNSFFLRVLGSKPCLDQCKCVAYCEIPVVLKSKPIKRGLLRLENVNFRVTSVFGNCLLLTELMSSDLTEQMLKAFWKFCFSHVVNENYLFQQ